MGDSETSSTLNTTEMTTPITTKLAQNTTFQTHSISNLTQSSVSETQSTEETTKRNESTYAFTPSKASSTLNSSTISNTSTIKVLFPTILGILVICICIVSIRTYKRRFTNFNREAKIKFTPETVGKAKVPATLVLYDDIEPDIEITFISPSRATNGQQNQTLLDTNPYIECPNNLYDKMFISRPHVNENEGNVYQKVDVRNNRYSMVRPFGAETTNSDN